MRFLLSPRNDLNAKIKKEVPHSAVLNKEIPTLDPRK
jgi:hypothetical protein